MEVERFTNQATEFTDIEERHRFDLQTLVCSLLSLVTEVKVLN